MDLNVKQWRYHQQVQESSDSDHLPQSAAKLPRLLDVQQQYQQQQSRPSPSGSPPPGPLPLFVPQPTTKLAHLSPLIPPDHSTPTTAASTFPKMGSYFSVGQWQELELQALIFRHMLAGAAVPPQLLHLVKNSLFFNNSAPPPPLPPHPLLQHYYNNSHYHPSLQSGYWGRSSLDPEPGRCRRTDGKKWRCSRDVVAGHKYCERHMHRGRNRSRKPVEIPTSSAAGDGRGGGVPKINGGFAAAQPLSGPTYFELTAPSPSIDLFHLNQRPSESRTVDKSGLFDADNEASGDGKSSGQVLRHFFDDWPRSLQQHDDNGGSNPGPITSSSPCLSMSTASNPTSDFSLKLSTGNGDDHQAGNQELGGSVVVGRGRLQSNWASGGWGTTTMGGGPLAEVLRSSSSTSNSSPTSVLHQLPRISASEASCMSTSVQ